MYTAKLLLHVLVLSLDVMLCGGDNIIGLLPRYAETNGNLVSGHLSNVLGARRGKGSSSVPGNVSLTFWGSFSFDLLILFSRVVNQLIIAIKRYLTEIYPLLYMSPC
jgi:hypothetical protein